MRRLRKPGSACFACKSLIGIYLASAQPREPVGCQARRRDVAGLRQGAATPQATGSRGCPQGSSRKGTLRRCPACSGGCPERRAAPCPAPVLRGRTCQINTDQTQNSHHASSAGRAAGGGGGAGGGARGGGRAGGRGGGGEGGA